ncbi:hypothetical protein V565_222570, partial [Rhizoctonia solani 123E]
MEPDTETWGEEIEPGVRMYQRPDGTHNQDPSIGMSILEFCSYIESLPSAEAQNRAILQGTKLDGTPLVLNWLKDSIDLDPSALVRTLDLDSLSATLLKPVFKSIVNIAAWPDRSRTLTTNNGLQIYHKGKRRPLSHFEPEIKARRYVTMVDEDVMEPWYNGVFLGAFKEIGNTLPPNLRGAYLQLKQELPTSYKTASSSSIHPGQKGKAQKLTAISPEFMNLIVPAMRRIVDTQDQFKQFRGYFFHIFGINLKTGAQSIPGREEENLLQHAFNTYPVLDFNKINTQDVVADIGYEIMVDPVKLPDGPRPVTLLWNFSAALPLIAPKWRSPQIDRYMGSEVVAGGRSIATKKPRATGIIKAQFYSKDKNQTHGHIDHSKGTSFSTDQAMRNAIQFITDMAHLQGAWEDLASFGVAHNSADVARIKETFRRNYVQIIRRTQALPAQVREKADAKCMVATVSHLIKSLVKRPDDHSSSRELSTFQKNLWGSSNTGTGISLLEQESRLAEFAINQKMQGVLLSKVQP